MNLLSTLLISPRQLASGRAIPNVRTTQYLMGGHSKSDASRLVPLHVGCRHRRRLSRSGSPVNVAGEGYGSLSPITPTGYAG